MLRHRLFRFQFHTAMAIASLLSMFSCNYPTEAEQASLSISTGDTATLISTTRVTADYLQIKNALINTDNDLVQRSAIIMQEHVVAFRNQLERNSEYSHLPSDLTAVLKTLSVIDSSLMLIIRDKDLSCEQKRVYFAPLSEATYTFLRLIPSKDQKLYRVICPMAFNEQGAYWLSEFKEIKNPYFGKKMLSCGEIVDSLFNQKSKF
jgi:Cu(I)/Ag(I) efflux system membrane fusion protein